jgi:hypothetical protein
MNSIKPKIAQRASSSLSPPPIGPLSPWRRHVNLAVAPPFCHFVFHGKSDVARARPPAVALANADIAVLPQNYLATQTRAVSSAVARLKHIRKRDHLGHPEIMVSIPILVFPCCSFLASLPSLYVSCRFAVQRATCSRILARVANALPRSAAVSPTSHSRRQRCTAFFFFFAPAHRTFCLRRA